MHSQSHRDTPCFGADVDWWRCVDIEGDRRDGATAGSAVRLLKGQRIHVDAVVPRCVRRDCDLPVADVGPAAHCPRAAWQALGVGLHHAAGLAGGDGRPWPKRVGQRTTVYLDATAGDLALAVQAGWFPLVQLDLVVESNGECGADRDRDIGERAGGG